MKPMKESVRIRIQYYGGRLARLLFGMRVRGSRRVPRMGGLIIACNHISELDPPVLGFAIPRTVAYMAKVELFGMRVTDFFLRKLNAFPVNRSSIDTRALRTAIEHLKRGEAVVIFPEGTRSRDGRLLPVKAGISLVAISSGVPVLPAFIWGTDNAGKALARTGPPFSVTFGRMISGEGIREIRKSRGNRAVAELIMAGISETGMEAGLYSE